MARQSLPDAEGPDPGRITSQQDFGRELTLARQQAGLTIRDVAKASGIPVSTVGDYFAARHLPPARQPELLPSILAACQITEAEQVDRWLHALNRVRRAPGRPPAGPAPYRGLASFQPEDAAWFFGREELALHLVRLATGPGAPGLPLAVVGPSGSGKSSLLRAGLVPRLRSGTTARPGGRPVVLITPGATPVQTLAGQLAALAWPPAEGPLRTGLLAQGLREDPERHARLASRGDEPPAIIVDQLEEIFTAGADEGERSEFVAALAALSQHTLVVLGLRADFYGHALGYPALARALQERQIVVGPMSACQLRRAIVEPARKAGREVEDGLVEVLLRDVRPHGAPGAAGGHEAGALPLLSHALLATWSRSRGSRLTLADYQASGGIRDAIARTAEQAYATLDMAGQELARQLFLRLVHVGEDGREARARLPLRDLPGDASAAAAVLERFVGQRLVTKDRTAAEIAHEALLGAWPRLRAWIDADREDIRLRHFIEVAAQAWAQAGREAAALLRGGQLALAADWMAGAAHRAALSKDARDFVDAAIAEERSQQAAARRRTRRLRQLVAALTVLVLRHHRPGRVRLPPAAACHHRQGPGRVPDSGRGGQPDPPRGPGAGCATVAGRVPHLAHGGGAGQPARVVRRPGSGAHVRLRPRRAGRRIVPGPPAARGRRRRRHTAAVAVSPGPATRYSSARWRNWGIRIAVRCRVQSRRAGAGRGRRRWEGAAVERHRATAPGAARTGSPGRTSTVYSLAFSPRSGLLAAGSADETVRLWDVRDPAHPVAEGGPLTGAKGYVQAVAFSPDGRLLAAASADKTVRLWNVADPARPQPAGKPLAGPGGAVDSVAFSPDGADLAAGSYDDKVWLWHVADPGKPVLLNRFTGATDWIMAVAFSPDGKVLAAAGSDGQVRLWNTATGAPIAVIPHPQPVTSLAWDGPGVLVTGDADGYVRAWHLPVPDLLADGPVYSIALNPAARVLAVGGAGLQVWNPDTRALTATATVPGELVNAVALSPGGNLIATGYSDGRIQLWRRGARLVPLGTPRTASHLHAGFTNQVEFVAFSPDGKLLASGGDDGTVRLWDLTDPAHPRQLAVIPDPKTLVFAVAFSPGRHVLAAATADGRIRLWNVTDPAAPVQLGKALTGPANTAYSVAFSPDGQVLAVGSADRDIRLWDVSDPARPHRIGPVLACPAGYVYSVAFSPGGNILAAGNTDGSVWLWNLARPTHPALIATLAGPSGHVYSVAFGPDGRTLAAADSSGLVWLWDTGDGTAAHAVCATAGQPLTRAEWSAYVPGLPYAPPCR